LNDSKIYCGVYFVWGYNLSTLSVHVTRVFSGFDDIVVHRDVLLCAATEMSYAEAERERASIVAKYRLVIEDTV